MVRPSKAWQRPRCGRFRGPGMGDFMGFQAGDPGQNVVRVLSEGGRRTVLAAGRGTEMEGQSRMAMLSRVRMVKRVKEAALG